MTTLILGGIRVTTTLPFLNAILPNGMKPILGGAVGATSVLMIRSHADDKTSVQENPKGICIAILANIQDCGGLLDLAIDLAEVFEKNNLLRN